MATMNRSESDTAVRCGAVAKCKTCYQLVRTLPSIGGWVRLAHHLYMGTLCPSEEGF